MPDDQKLPASLREVGVRDTRLIERAIRQQWPIRQEIRAALIDRQISIATSETVSPGEATSAFRAVLAANQQNLALANRPKRRPPTITATNVIVVGDLEESRRRAIAFMNEHNAQRDAIRGDSPDDAVLTLSQAVSPDDA